jgi:hypothetical protein
MAISPFREIGRIGKSIIAKVVGLERNYKKVEMITIRDYSICNSSCPFYKFKSSQNEYCNKHCEKVVKKTPSISYINEKHHYNLQSVPTGMSKSQIKQFLYYHFLPIDDNGIIQYVSIHETATKLDCTEKTVRNNLDKFVDTNLLSYTKINADLYTLYLPDYKKYHLTRYQGGTGYIQLAQEAFHKILNINNVNSLRLELRRILKFDNDYIKVKDIDTYSDIDFCSTYTFDEIKRVMPDHINYKNIIQNTLNNTSDIFSVEQDDTTIKFKLKDEYNSQFLKESKYLNFKHAFYNFYNSETLISYPRPEELEDLVQMSFEYGFESVIEALRNYIQNYYNNNIVIKNVCGFIRTLIRKSMFAGSFT